MREQYVRQVEPCLDGCHHKSKVPNIVIDKEVSMQELFVHWQSCTMPNVPGTTRKKSR